MDKLPISFEKKIISNKHSNDIYSKNFQKLITEEDILNEEKIIDSYEDLFYAFPKKGKHSHQKITEQEYNYIHHKLNTRLDSNIDKLVGYIASKDGELDDKTHLKNQHPIWEDGAIIMIGGNGNPAMGHEDQMFIIQEGRRREISPAMQTLVKKCREIPITDDPFAGVYFISIDEFNEIPDGPPISSESDLNLKGTSLITDLGDLMGLSAFVSCSITCQGNEIQDTFNLILNDDTEAEAQYYLNEQGCYIRYIYDKFINDDTEYQVKFKSIPKGTTVELPILRRTISGREGAHTENLPSNLHAIHDAYTPATITYNGNEISNYIKNWGPNSFYESIVAAEGRMTIKEHDSHGVIPLQDTGLKVLNGLPTSGSGYWEVVDLPDDFGEELSVYGTRRLYGPGSGYWGGLNQNMEVQEMFNKMDHRYYKETKDGGGDLKDGFLKAIKETYGGAVEEVFSWFLNAMPFHDTKPIYGQPIIRFDNTYNVIISLKSYGVTLPDWIPGIGGDRFAAELFIVYDIVNGGIRQISKKKMKNRDIELEMDGGHIKRIKWEDVPDHRIAYIGLRGVGICGHYSSGHGNDNYFNNANYGDNFSFDGSIPN